MFCAAFAEQMTSSDGSHEMTGYTVRKIHKTGLPEERQKGIRQVGLISGPELKPDKSEKSVTDVTQCAVLKIQEDKQDGKSWDMICLIVYKGKYLKRKIKGYSSVGRTLVSKTKCRGFESFCPC